MTALTESDREALTVAVGKWFKSNGRRDAMIQRDIAPMLERILAEHESEGWAFYAAEQERHAETNARLERLRDGVAHLHDVYAVAPNEPRCCSDCAALDISAELRRLLRRSSEGVGHTGS